MRIRMGLPGASPLSASLRSRPLAGSDAAVRSDSRNSLSLWWLTATRKPTSPSPATAITAASTRATNLANRIPRLVPPRQARASVPASPIPISPAVWPRLVRVGPPPWRGATPKTAKCFLALLRQLRKSARTYHERDEPFARLPANHFPRNLGHEISPKGGGRDRARAHGGRYLDTRCARRRQSGAKSDAAAVGRAFRLGDGGLRLPASWPHSGGRRHAPQCDAF